MTEAQFPNTLGNLGLEPNEAEIQNINVGFLPRPSQYPVVPIAAQTCPQILGSAPQSGSIQLAAAAHALGQQLQPTPPC